jgi:hypothetical protein
MSEYPTNYPKYGFHACNGCGIMAPHHTQEQMPENGWVIPFEHLGYYAGFTDEIEVLLGERESNLWTLCHDCVIKLLETFPLLGILIEKGAHSMFGPNDIPCCKYAWKAEWIGETCITSYASDDGTQWIAR